MILMIFIKMAQVMLNIIRKRISKNRSLAQLRLGSFFAFNFKGRQEKVNACLVISIAAMFAGNLHLPAGHHYPDQGTAG